MTNVETILKNTTADTLFELFKAYTDRLVENSKSLGIFAVDQGYDVFNPSDIRKVIKQLKEKKN